MIVYSFSVFSVKCYLVLRVANRLSHVVLTYLFYSNTFLYCCCVSPLV